MSDSYNSNTTSQTEGANANSSYNGQDDRLAYSVNNGSSEVINSPGQHPYGDYGTDGNNKVQEGAEGINDRQVDGYSEQNPEINQQDSQSDRTCFIGNIGPHYDENDLNSILSLIAKPISVHVPRDHMGRTKGVAFAEFPSKETAVKVVGYFKKESYKGRLFHIKLASDPYSPPGVRKLRQERENYRSRNYGDYDRRMDDRDRYYRPMHDDRIRDDRYGPPRERRYDDRDYRDSRGGYRRDYDRGGYGRDYDRGGYGRSVYDRDYGRSVYDRDYDREPERGYDRGGRYERGYDSYERSSGDRSYYQGQSGDYQSRSTSGYGYDYYGQGEAQSGYGSASSSSYNGGEGSQSIGSYSSESKPSSSYYNQK